MKRRSFLKGSAMVGFTLATNGLFLKASGMYSHNSNRKVLRIVNSERVNVGTLPVFRAFAGDMNDYVSPFVLLDEFGPVHLQPSQDPLRVDAHPHAGVTPTTYFLEGSGHHKDSLNYDFQIEKGDFMLFSSGRGAIHMEESGQKLYDEGGNYHGFQIWLNTPSKYKFQDPTTDVFRTSHMDKIENPDHEIKVVLGNLGLAYSSIELQSPAFYYHVKAKPKARIDIPTNPNHNAFIYMVKGKLELEEQNMVKTNQLALFKRGESNINIYAQQESEFLVLGGEPLNEPVFSYGPFVMNNEEQIRECIKNYRSGKMGNPEMVNR